MKYLLILFIFFAIFFSQRSHSSEVARIQIMDEGLFSDFQLELLCRDSRWPIRVESELKWHTNALDVTFTRLDTTGRDCHYRLALMGRDDFDNHLVLRKFVIE